MELQEAIEKRRSVRKFTDHYVSDQEIHAILEAARKAPSWANTQVWSYIVVRDPGLIEEVTGTYSEKNPAAKGSMTCSALIVACAKTGISGCSKGEDVTKFHEWFMFDLGLAVQNINLKACELGLGTVVVGLMDHDACKKLLGLPEEYEVVASMPVGRPLDPDKNGPARKELKEFAFLDKFGEPYGKIY